METNERNELADRLHDEPIQVLAGVALRLEVLRGKIGDPENSEILQGAAEGVDRALKFIRELIAELRGEAPGAPGS